MATVTQSFSRAILEQLAFYNIQLAPALRQALADYADKTRLPLPLLDALWQTLESHVEPGAGLKIGRALMPQHFDTMGFLLLSSPSLSVAVDSLINYSPLVGEGGSFSKVHESRGWKVTYDARFTAALVLRIEAIFASIATGASWVAGKNITPIAVSFSHPQQTSLANYQQVFGEAQVAFNQPENAVVYAEADWHCKQRDVSEAVQTQMLELARLQLSQLTPQSFEDKVRTLLTNQPWLTRNQMAASLAVSERTLTRKLNRFGVSYQGLSQDVKKAYALQHICEAHITQAGLAEYLGYSDESAFAKAFLRWTGMGFRAYQQKHCTCVKASVRRRYTRTEATMTFTIS